MRGRGRLWVRSALLVVTVALLTVGGAVGLPQQASASPTCEVGRHASHLPGTTVCTVRVGTKQRSFLLSVPPSDAPAPLVVAFHGLTQTARVFATQTDLVPATRAAGVVLAMPESDGPAFNDGRLGANGPQDQALTLALLNELVSARVVDPHRVVVSGYSNGAGMAMALASLHPEAVAALISVDGSLIDAPGAPRPTGPVRAILVHGNADKIQPWEGRPAKGEYLPAYIPVPATVRTWVEAAGAGPAVVQHLPGSLGRDPVEMTSWAAGPSGATVVSYIVGGMGHVWPVGEADNLDATTLIVHTATTLSSTVNRIPNRVSAVAAGRAIALHH